MTANSAASPRLKTPIALLAGMAVASPVAMNIFAPVMPAVAEQFNTEPFMIQMGFTLYLFTLAVGQLISGPLADRYGRRPILFWGFLLHILGCLLGALATDVWTLLIARVLQAAGGCTGMLLARSIILDQHGKDKAAGMLGYITLGIATAQAVAPTAGGYLNLWAGWQSVFWISMAMGTVVWLGALLTMRETATQDNDKTLLQSFRRYETVLKTPAFIWYALSSTLIASGFFIFITSAPFLVSGYLAGNSADYGNWFLLVAGGFWLGSLTAGKITASAGTDKMLTAGISISTLATLLMLTMFTLLPFSYLALFLPMAIFTFGRGLVQPSAQAAAVSATTGAVATATGMQGFFQLLIGSLIAQVTPLLLAIDLTMLPVTLFVVSAAAWFCFRKGKAAE